MREDDVTINVDCDNDAVRIQRGDDDPIVIRPRRPHGAFWMSDVLSVLEEALNLIEAPNVSLTKQDEGAIRTIAEW